MGLGGCILEAAGLALRGLEAGLRLAAAAGLRERPVRALRLAPALRPALVLLRLVFALALLAAALLGRLLGFAAALLGRLVGLEAALLGRLVGLEAAPEGGGAACERLEAGSTAIVFIYDAIFYLR
jgi:hypothetical protein